MCRCAEEPKPDKPINFYISEDDTLASLEQKGIHKLKREPKNFLEKTSSFFDNLSFLENNAHLVDGIFHLTQPLFKQYAPTDIYQKAHDLHQATHFIDHFLHSFHFFHDLTILSIDVKNFIDDILRQKSSCQHQKDCCEKTGNGTSTLISNLSSGLMNRNFILRTSARVCLIASHILETAAFLSELKRPIGSLEPFLKYAPLLSFSGYMLLIISALWKQIQDQKNPINSEEENVWQLPLIYFSGSIFKLGDVMKIASHSNILNKIAEGAGVIHAFTILHFLSVTDTVPVKFVRRKI